VTNLDDAGTGSLRQALIDTPSGGTVDFQAGLSGTITLTSGALAITKDLTISGPGANVITVSGGHHSQVVTIASSTTVAISGLTIADGTNSGFLNAYGGGIENSGTLTLTRCTVAGNSIGGHSANGGGIGNYGVLTITNCTISDNNLTTDHGGGGIRNDGTMTIIDSTLRDNSITNLQEAGGGAILNLGGVMKPCLMGKNPGIVKFGPVPR
jgi:hypothetical protein